MLSNAYLYLVSVDMIVVVFIGGWYVLRSAISVNDWLADKQKGWGREETSGFRLKFPDFPTKLQLFYIKFRSKLDKCFITSNTKMKTKP